jgi:hypothetical protein
MKKLFLTSIAALFLATGAAHVGARAADSSFMLPSQEKPNFFTVQICRDPRRVLGVIRSMAFHILKTTKVIIAHGVGPDWSGYDPDDIRLEGVLTNTNNTVMVFCSATFSANEVTERVVYAIRPDPDHFYAIELGGDYGPAAGHVLFPYPITIRPASTSQ